MKSRRPVNSIVRSLLMPEDVAPDQSGLRKLFSQFRRARRFVRWWPLLTAPVMLVLHVIIELNFVSYVPYPHEHSPLLIGVGFRAMFWGTLLLALFIFPRWQSFVALLSIAKVILSLGGR